jgi:hypothetical protein
VNFFENLKYFGVIALVASICAVIYIFNVENYYRGFLFYPDKDLNGLLAENRAIIKGSNEKERIRNIVEELITGPIDPKLVNFFPKESKLNSLWIDGRTVLLDFNRETLLNVNADKYGKFSAAYLLLFAITNSICFHEKRIERVKFYFDGVSYKNIENIENFGEGLRKDFKIFLK